MKMIASIALALLFLTAARATAIGVRHEGRRAGPPCLGENLPSNAPRAAAQDSDTETVLSTLRCRPGKEDELQSTLTQEWATLRKLNLVLADPHILLKGKDDGGKPIFVDIFTWRDHDAPDHVPQEVQAIWNHLQALVEARDGHKGIEFPEFQIVTP